LPSESQVSYEFSQRAFRIPVKKLSLKFITDLLEAIIDYTNMISCCAVHSSFLIIDLSPQRVGFSVIQLF